MPSSSKRDAVLRQQRDRFVGFAFAGGDLLIETDRAGRIAYVAGAAQTMTGHAEETMIGCLLADLVVPELAEIVTRFLDDLRSKGRALPCRTGFEKASGRWLIMSGYAGGKHSDVLQLSLRFDVQNLAEGRPMLGADLFKEQLLDGLQDHDQASTLTMLDLSELESWSDEAADACRNEISKSLQTVCSEDSTAGWLDDSVLGIVQTAEMDVEALEAAVRTHSKVLDPSGVGFNPRSAALPLDKAGLSPGDAGQALLYAINHFAETQGEGFDIKSLGDGFDKMVKETVARVVEVRETVGNDDVVLNFQPIVDLKTGYPHHYEVLSRIKDDQSPFDLVCFAEQVGLITEFDLMVCRRAIAMLDARQERTLPLAINLSARSMECQAFGRALITLLGKFPQMRGRLMFEITESAAISDPEPVAAHIEALQKMSYKVCLDDFGSGAAAFHYLRAFRFDCVKIDGMYIRSSGKRDNAILRGMAALCRELGVTSVAEMIETEAQASFLRRLGIDHGQGYFFGRPTADLPSTKESRSFKRRSSNRSLFPPLPAKPKDSQQKTG